MSSRVLEQSCGDAAAIERRPRRERVSAGRRHRHLPLARDGGRGRARSGQGAPRSTRRSPPQRRSASSTRTTSRSAATSSPWFAIPPGDIRFVNATGRAPARRQIVDGCASGTGIACPSAASTPITVPGGVRGWEALAGIGRAPELARAARVRPPARRGRAPARAVGRGARSREHDDARADPGLPRRLPTPDGEPVAEGDRPCASPRWPARSPPSATAGLTPSTTGRLADAWVAGLRRARRRDHDRRRAAPSARTWTNRSSGASTAADVVTGPPEHAGLRVAAHPPGRRARARCTRPARELTPAASPRSSPRPTASARTGSPIRTWDSDGARAAHVAVPPRADDEPRRPTATRSASWRSATTGGPCHSCSPSSGRSAPGCSSPDTGVLFQNRGTSFSLDPRIPPSSRPADAPRTHSCRCWSIDDGPARRTCPRRWVDRRRLRSTLSCCCACVAVRRAAEAMSAPRFVVGTQDDGDTAEHPAHRVRRSVRCAGGPRPHNGCDPRIVAPAHRVARALQRDQGDAGRVRRGKRPPLGRFSRDRRTRHDTGHPDDAAHTGIRRRHPPARRRGGASRWWGSSRATSPGCSASAGGIIVVPALAAPRRRPAHRRRAAPSPPSCPPRSSARSDTH